MDILDEAAIFATRAHSGQKRKMSGIPYILHPMEVAVIIGTMTDDKEIMAAGLLHDTVEDCGIDPREIKEKFGARVAALVASETEDKMLGLPPEASWQDRKADSLLVLKYTKDPGVKILWMGDKLSNMRSFYRSYRQIGNKMFESLHQKDPVKHEWYYRKIADYLAELKDTDAYKEYVSLIDEIF